MGVDGPLFVPAFEPIVNGVGVEVRSPNRAASLGSSFGSRLESGLSSVVIHAWYNKRCIFVEYNHIKNDLHHRTTVDAP